MQQNLIAAAFCQRWRHGRASYRPAREPLDPSRYGVEVISESDAKRFTVTHHYSHAYPAARFRVGLMRCRPAAAAELVGVAVFSVPASQAVVPKWTGLPPAQGIELGRFCLWDEIEANAESWFLARAFRLLAEALPDVQAVLSFSDPVRRTSLDGSPVMPGHVGVCYQATGARHVGRSTARTLYLDRHGRVVSGRALAKLRGDEQGAAYAYSQLLAAGAPPARPNEPSREYVARALAEGPFRRFRHPGNLAYVWPTARAAKGLVKQFPAALPYPKSWNTVVDPRPAARQV